VKESRERIKSAIKNCGFELHEEGLVFDLKMALSLTGYMRQFFGKALDKMMFIGELSLGGTVRPVRGALSATLAARESGLRGITVPQANAHEAAVEGIDALL